MSFPRLQKKAKSLDICRSLHTRFTICVIYDELLEKFSMCREQHTRVQPIVVNTSAKAPVHVQAYHIATALVCVSGHEDISVEAVGADNLVAGAIVMDSCLAVIFLFKRTLDIAARSSFFRAPRLINAPVYKSNDTGKCFRRNQPE